jgi:hypothetical protein
MKVVSKKIIAVFLTAVLLISAFSSYSFSALANDENKSDETVSSEVDVLDNADAEETTEKQKSFSFSPKNTLPNSAADFSAFDDAYNQADEFLRSLAIIVPLYFDTDIENLIALITGDEVQNYVNMTEEERAACVSGGEEETEANALAQDILDQIDVVKACEGELDISAYRQAVLVSLDTENDAYDYPEEQHENDLVYSTKLVKKSISYGDLTLLGFKSTTSVGITNAVTTAILGKLNTNIRMYQIEIVEGEVNEDTGITFNNGKHEYDSATGLYSASYDTTLNLTANSESAWYISIESPSVSRGKQYQGSGKRFSTKVLGNIKVYVYNSNSNHKVTVARKYSDSSSLPIAYITYVNGEYTLPTAPAIPFYTFSGYRIGSALYSAGDVINISADTDIYALYTKNEELSFAINVEGEEGTNAAYNTRLSYSGNSDTYAWLELDKTTGKYKPFYIGKNISFFVTESINLKKVTQEEFNACKFKLPAINIRQDGAYSFETDGTKKVNFCGQFVTDGTYEIAECGIILGRAKAGGSVCADDVNLENIGTSEEYTLSRFKSTKNVGANQFSIGVKNLSGDVIYKGYLTYKVGTYQYITVYSDAISETL